MSIGLAEKQKLGFFSCLPIQDLAKVQQQSDKVKDLSAQNILWRPILVLLDPTRYAKGEVTSTNAQADVTEKVSSETWKKKVRRMILATGNSTITELVTDKPCFEKLQLLAPEMGKILEILCKKGETLYQIPQFFVNSFDGYFFTHLYAGYKASNKDERYLYLILYFIKTKKNCATFFQLCRGDAVYQEDETLKRLLYLGIGCGISIADFKESGMQFDFLDKSKYPFVQFILLNKKELMEFSKSGPCKDKKDHLREKLPPIPLTDERFLKEFEFLCQQSPHTINAVFNENTALNIAFDNHYEKEVDILRKNKGVFALGINKIAVVKQDLVEKEEDFCEVIPDDGKEDEEGFFVITG